MANPTRSPSPDRHPISDSPRPRGVPEAPGPVVTGATGGLMQLVDELATATAQWAAADHGRIELLRRYHLSDRSALTAAELLLVGQYHQFMRERFVSPEGGHGHPQSLIDLLLTTPPYPFLIFPAPLPAVTSTDPSPI